MAKHTGDREIGARAAQLIREKGGRAKDQMHRLGLRRQDIYAWESGENVPSVYALQAMAYQGYDVTYILTGHSMRGSVKDDTR